MVYWSGKDSLCWGDFKGSPRLFSNYSAQSFCTIWLEKKYTGDSAIVKVDAVFFKDSSWVDEGRRSSGLLNHEKRHFDIFEIAARMIREELYNYDGRKREDVEYYSPGVSDNEYGKYVNSLNREYDSVTHHGINKMEQERWNKRIDSLLEEYDDYEDDHVRIGVK